MEASAIWRSASFHRSLWLSQWSVCIWEYPSGPVWSEGRWAVGQCSEGDWCECSQTGVNPSTQHLGRVPLLLFLAKVQKMPWSARSITALSTDVCSQKLSDMQALSHICEQGLCLHLRAYCCETLGLSSSATPGGLIPGRWPLPSWADAVSLLPCSAPLPKSPLTKSNPVNKANAGF